MALLIYEITSDFPKTEIYGLTSQIRRAAVSIPTNISEGSGRNSDVELSRFLTISMGSASEVEYLLQLAHDLKYITKENYTKMDSDFNEIQKMLTSFIKRLKS